MTTVGQIPADRPAAAWPGIYRSAPSPGFHAGIQPPTDDAVKVSLHSSNVQHPPSPVDETASGKATEEKEEFSFWDLLDVINPLQHIPVVSTLYRAITGDEIKAPASIIGGGVFGGIIGAAAGAVNSLISKLTGKDLGEHVLAALDLDNALDSGVDAESDAAGRGTAAEGPMPAEDAGTRITLPGTPANFSRLRSLLTGEEPDSGTVRPLSRQSGVSFRENPASTEPNGGDAVKKDGFSGELSVNDALSAALRRYRQLDPAGRASAHERDRILDKQVDLMG